MIHLNRFSCMIKLLKLKKKIDEKNFFKKKYYYLNFVKLPFDNSKQNIYFQQ